MNTEQERNIKNAMIVVQTVQTLDEVVIEARKVKDQKDLTEYIAELIVVGKAFKKYFPIVTAGIVDAYNKNGNQKSANDVMASFTGRLIGNPDEDDNDSAY